VILLSTWVFEHLEMSRICLGMFLGLPYLKMAGWDVFIAFPLNYSRWTESCCFCRRAHRTCTVHCLVPWPRQPTVGDCSSRPLNPTVTQTFRCTLDSLVLHPEGAWLRAPLCRLPGVRCTPYRYCSLSGVPPVHWLTAVFMDFFAVSLGFFCS
jgi:hypothetical protein